MLVLVLHSELSRGRHFAVLCELASLNNCQGWLSVDSENYGLAILAKCKAPSVWKLALLQDKDLHTGVLEAIKQNSTRGDIVNFPYHRAGRHVTPLQDGSVMVCPAVTGSYKLESDCNEPRPCQVCTFCLPVLR